MERGRAHILQDKRIPDDVTIFRIHGPFLFGSTDKLTDLIAHVNGLTPIVVLRLRNMTAIDATGLRAIQDFADALQQSGRTLRAVRSAAAAGATDVAGRVPPACGGGEHRAECGCSAEASRGPPAGGASAHYGMTICEG